MKYKKIMLVTLMLLAILTVGAVSAADLTVNETQDPVGLSVDDESIIAEEENIGDDNSILAEDEVLGDADSSEMIDINLSSDVIPKYYVTHMDGDYDADGVEFYIAPGFRGNVILTLNDTEFYNSYCYDEVYGIYLARLDYGTYNWELRIVDNSGQYNPLTLNGTTNIVPVDIEIPEHVIIGGRDDILIYYSMYTGGTITVLIDGKKYYEGQLYDEEDCSIKRIHLNDISFENHTCEVIYSGYGDFKALTVNQTFDVDYYLNYYIFEEDIDYGDNVALEIDIPEDAKGNITVTLNGKKYTEKADELDRGEFPGSKIIDITNFKPGENNFTITYEGDDKYYYPKTIEGTKYVNAKIQYSYNMAFTDAIILRLPDDAKGNLVVKVNDETYANVSAKNGIFNVSLKDLALGDYSIEASYDGDDYEVESVSDYIRITPKFTYPKVVGYFENVLISIEVPNGVEGTFKIYERDPAYSWDDEEITEINSTELADGRASLILNKFHKTSYDDFEDYNRFILEFKNNDYNYRQNYDPSVRNYPKDSDFNIILPETVKKSTSFICIVEDNVERTYDVYVDGVYLTSVYNQKGEDDYDSEPVTLVLDNIEYGKHKIEFRYEDSSGYYNSINKTYYINVVYITFDIPEEIVSEGEVKAEFDENVTGTLTLYLNGEEFASRFINGSKIDEYSFYIDDLAYGKYDCEVVYSGDANHARVSKKSTIESAYLMNIINLDEKTNQISGQNLDWTVSLPRDVNGTVSITVNGKKYSAKARDYTDFKIDGIKYGLNEIILSYEGDNKYPARTKTYQITGILSIKLEDDTLILDMPGDATGNMVVDIDYDQYMTVPVTNGKAVLKLNELDMGSYYIEARYDGADYNVYDFYEMYYSFNITKPKYVWIEEGCMISVELPKDCNGQLIIEHLVEDEDEWGYIDHIFKEINRTDIINGSGSIRLTAFDRVSDIGDDWENNRYKIRINLDEKSFSFDYTPIVMGKDPNFELTVDTQANILKTDRLTVETNLNEDMDHIDVYIDGEYYRRFFSEIFEIDASKLDYGNHYIEVRWQGTEYYPSKTAGTSFNITHILVDISENVTIGEYNAIDAGSLIIKSDDNVGGYVTVYIDSEIVAMKFMSQESIYVDLGGLNPGKHNYEVIYSGDENHPSTIMAGEFSTVYSGIAYVEYSYIDEGKDAEITVEMLKDATGQIEITVADKKYTKDVINGTAKFTVSGLSAGDYKITAKYLGDDKYPAYTIDTTEISVSSFESDYYYITIGETNIKYGESIPVSLKLPDDATGKLYVYLDKILYKKTDLVNGSAEIIISNLTYGEHKVEAKYDSIDYKYNVYTEYDTIYVEPVKGDYNIVNTFNDTVIIPLEFADDINGDLMVYINYELTGTQKIANGKVSADLTGKLDLGYNIINFKYDNDKYNIDYSVYIFIIPDAIVPENMTIGEDKEAQFIFGSEYNGDLTVYYGLVNDRENKESVIKAKVVNGKASVSLSELTHGLNYIGFYYEDATHEFSSYNSYYESRQLRVNVLNKKSDMTVYNTTESTKIKLDDDATGTVIVKINGNYYTEELKNGEAVIDAVGDEIIISYSGDAKYESFENIAVNSSGAEIELIDPEITVNADDINVGDILVISIDANKNLTAAVNVTVNNKEYTVDIITGKGNMSIDDLTAGIYNINVIFSGNDLFKKAKNSTTFSVNKIAPTIIIKADESIVEESDLSLELTVEGATGNVTVNDVEIALKDGKATTNISNLPLGENIITVFYKGDEKYLNATESIKVNVFAKSNPELIISVSDINVGDDAVVNIEINRNTTGKVTVDGNEISITDGKGTYTITKPAEGNHTITVKYEGDKYFTQDEKTAQYKVAKKEFPPEEDPISSKDNETESETPTYSINLPSDATGTLEVTIGNKTYTKELTNGSATITVDDLPAGDYTATLKYSGDAKYAPITKTVNTSVKAKDPELKVNVENVIIGEDATVNIEINPNATGKVTVDGTEVNIKDGKGTYTITKPAEGNHTITVKYEGDKYFTQDEKTAQYNVAKKVIPEEDPFAPSADENKTSESNPTFTINLSSDATGTLTVTIGDKTYTKELTNGSATITVDDLPAGDYTATLSYSGDAKYPAITKSVNGTVKVDPVIAAKATSVQYNAGKYFQVTVYGTDGKLAANTPVTFVVAGKTFKTVNTDANGIAKFKVTQIPKTYTVTAKALGASATAKLTVKHVVTLKSATVKKSAKKLVLQAKLAKVNGKYLAKKRVTFKFNGKTYKATTDKKGVAKVTIPKRVLSKLKVGKKITYQATYLKDTVKKTTKVKK